jgi:AcrR family transcriptional regulator
MARWDPGAEDRLRRAALELYAERGYDAVTVAQIAGRAGLARRSFFRYFPDKREVLFAGSERLPAALADAIAKADPALSPLDAVVIAFRSIGTRMMSEVAGLAERRAIIASSAELQERDRTKRDDVARAISGAIEGRGVGQRAAALVGPVAAALFWAAFERSIERGGRDAFASCLDEVIAELSDFIAATRHDAAPTRA